MVVITPIQNSLVNIYCDTCKIPLQKVPIVLLSHPPIYQYACTSCGNLTQSRTSYPYVQQLEDLSLSKNLETGILLCH